MNAPVPVAKLAKSTASSPPRRLALYMFYNPTGQVPEYVTYKLEKLRAHAERIVVVCNGVLSAAGRESLEKVVDAVHVRKNEGFDVWAYREGLVNVVGWKELEKYDEIILANYTFYGPIFPFSEMFDRMDQDPADFWGVTSFVGPTPNFFTGKGFIPSHIQSHFIAIRKKMVSSQAFRDYWEQMKPIRTYVDSVLEHETRFTAHFEKLGFKSSTYCDPSRYPVAQAAYEAVDLLLEDRCPILKRKPFFNDPLNVDASDVELARALELVRERSDYDLDLVWKDITAVARPRDLYTNASLFEVPLDTGPVVKLKPVKVAVLAHVFYPELLEEILGYARNIPVHFDLYVTTSTVEKKQQIEAMLAKEKKFTVKDVRVVQNRGRDVSALLIGLRDVVLEGGYDVVCRLHSKASPQDTFGMARHFKEHLFENLLASPAYVSRLLAIFEREPRVGIAFPPTIHIGYGTLGRSWFNNKPGAEHWSRELGISIPFDDHTPLCAHGSMYWFRPAALEPLFKYKFKWTDFPEEPHYADGDLPHILERLVVYAAHESRYIAKCVLTPKNAAKNYVNLEYKVHRRQGDVRAGRTTIDFPSQQLKEFAIERFSSFPTALRLARKSYTSTRSLLTMVMRRA